MKKSVLVALLVLFFTSSPAFAETYEIDLAHSSVSFKVRHLVGNVRGMFRELSGTIQYDEKNPAVSTIDVTIEAASIDTGNDKRDGHLRTSDFFDAEKFPDIKFKAKKVDAENKKITGDLTLHGVTKEVEIDYEFGGFADDPRGGKRLGGSGEVTIDRRDFGINYDPTGATIGHSVKVFLEIEATSNNG